MSVFQQGEYEDRITGNSTFEDGDWNGDGEFDSADLVLAFQRGDFLFEAMSHQQSAHLAAAVDDLLANFKSDIENYGAR